MPYISQIYSYSRTASADAAGLDKESFAVAGSSGEISEVLSTETVLSDTLDEIELSVLLVVVELSKVLEELSELLTEPELSGTAGSSSPLEVNMLVLLVDELSVLLDDVELSVLLVVEELSTALELVELSALLIVEELSTVLELVKLSEELVDELSGVPTEFSVLTEQAVIETASTRAVIFAQKRFINVSPFVYFI